MRNKSLAELMHEAWELAMDLTHETLAPDGLHYFLPRQNFAGLSSEALDTISGWADGLLHKYYNQRTSGRCSIKDMIEFDVGRFEEFVVKDIARMKEWLQKLGKPRVMTVDEMWARGYRGAWAGEFPQLTFPLDNDK